MKIKKWFVGISALLLVELLLFLVLTIAFPEKTTAGGHRGVIRQSMVDQQYEGKDAVDGNGGEGGDDEGNIRGEGDSREDDTGGEGNSDEDSIKGKGGSSGVSIRKEKKDLSEKSGKSGNQDKDRNEISSKESHQKKQDGKTEREIYKIHKQDLVLVNAKHAMKDSYDPSLRSICGGRLQASKRIYSSLAQMLSDAGEQGYYFWIASAYRSKERQQKLVDEDVTKAMRMGLSYRQALQETYRETMPAGHSEHQTGLALDILCSGNMKMDASQKAEPGNRWLRKNCSHYGFILRYPEEKSDITGVSFEPWHFRYVGKKAAEYMQDEGITLEEFWDRMG